MAKHKQVGQTMEKKNLDGQSMGKKKLDGQTMGKNKLDGQTMGKNKLVGQMDSRRTWAYLTVYWTVGWIVGIWKDYLSEWTMPTLTFWHVCALILTLFMQSHINMRYHSFGRRSSYLATACFAIGNGMAETMLFLAAYDHGRITTARMMGLSGVQAVAMGFFTFLLYSTFIHASFWDRLVFPPCITPGAPPFLTDTLPAVIAISLMWLMLYEFHGDVSIACLLHVLVDAWVATKIALPSPFAT
jgi:hypothetical protein